MIFDDFIDNNMLMYYFSNDSVWPVTKNQINFSNILDQIHLKFLIWQTGYYLR